MFYDTGSKSVVGTTSYPTDSVGFELDWQNSNWWDIISSAYTAVSMATALNTLVGDPAQITSIASLVLKDVEQDARLFDLDAPVSGRVTINENNISTLSSSVATLESRTTGLSRSGTTTTISGDLSLTGQLLNTEYENLEDQVGLLQAKTQDFSFDDLTDITTFDNNVEILGSITNTGFQTLQSKTQNLTADASGSTLSGTLSVAGSITNTGIQALEQKTTAISYNPTLSRTTFADNTELGESTASSMIINGIPFSTAYSEANQAYERTTDQSYSTGTTTFSTDVVISGALTNTGVQALEQKTTRITYNPTTNYTTISGQVEMGEASASTMVIDGTSFATIKNRTTDQTYASLTTTFANKLVAGTISATTWENAPQPSSIQNISSSGVNQTTISGTLTTDREVAGTLSSSSGILQLNAARTGESGVRGIYFRDGFTDYNCSILTYDHNGNFSDGLSINGSDGISFCSGSNSRNEVGRFNSGGLNVNGVVNNGTYANANGFMTGRTACFGDASLNYGGGTSGWLTNGRTAGLMLECLDTTEIAFHDAGALIASGMYYSGNKIYIGRNMGYGALGSLILQPDGGNVGIATATPFSKLTIGSSASGNGNVDEISFRSINNTAFQRIGYKQRIGFYGKDEYGNGNELYGAIECLYGDNIHYPNYPGHSSTNLIFKTNNRSGGQGYERMRLDYDGRLGIGTASPAVKLDIKASPLNHIGLLGSSSGRYTISTDTSGYKLFITNGTYSWGSWYYAHHYDVYSGYTGTTFTGSRDLYLNYYSGGNVRLAGSAIVSSDDRIKTNERYIENATQTLLKLKPQIYDKGANLGGTGATRVESGLIAQDVYYDAPELRHLIHHDDDAEIPDEKPFVDDDPQNDPDYSMWGSKSAGIDYEGLIAYLIKSNQEQQALIEALEAKIDAITRRLDGEV